MKTIVVNLEIEVPNNINENPVDCFFCYIDCQLGEFLEEDVETKKRILI